MWFYSFVFCLGFIIALPYFLVRAATTGRYRKGIRQRLGMNLPPVEMDAGKPWVWIHAVSVGEVEVAASVIDGIRQRWPEWRVLVTTTTTTGQEVARRRGADMTRYFPLDFPWGASGLLRRLQPKVILSMETEIWPNFFRAAENHGVPLALLNGRISDRSFKRYQRVRRLLAGTLERPALFAVQSQRDADRLIAMGAPARRVQITGNLKVDRVAGAVANIDGPAVRRELGIAQDRQVVIAGSTHGEENLMLIRALSALRTNDPNVLLLLVPRHFDHLAEYETAARAAGFATVRRSLLPNAADGVAPDVILGDTMGELGKFYAAADVAFVGGSLIQWGGQNILEPAALGIPVIHGPNMANFREARALLHTAGAAVEVQDEAALCRAILALLQDPINRRRMGEAGRAAINASRGALAATLDLVAHITRSAG